MRRGPSPTERARGGPVCEEESRSWLRLVSSGSGSFFIAGNGLLLFRGWGASSLVLSALRVARSMEFTFAASPCVILQNWSPIIELGGPPTVAMTHVEPHDGANSYSFEDSQRHGCWSVCAGLAHTTLDQLRPLSRADVRRVDEASRALRLTNAAVPRRRPQEAERAFFSSFLCSSVALAPRRTAGSESTSLLPRQKEGWGLSHQRG